MLMDLCAINLDLLKPHRLIEMLETDLQVGKQLFEHFGQRSLRSWRSHRGTGGIEEDLFFAIGQAVRDIKTPPPQRLTYFPEHLGFGCLPSLV
jgi:hypothetical protein